MSQRKCVFTHKTGPYTLHIKSNIKLPSHQVIIWSRPSGKFPFPDRPLRSPPLLQPVIGRYLK